jgi:hypothetical protein
MSETPKKKRKFAKDDDIEIINVIKTRSQIKKDSSRPIPCSEIEIVKVVKNVEEQPDVIFVGSSTSQSASNGWEPSRIERTPAVEDADRAEMTLTGWEDADEALARQLQQEMNAHVYGGLSYNDRQHHLSLLLEGGRQNALFHDLMGRLDEHY